jgi:hypothetical protein
MNKEKRISELTQYAIKHLQNIIPYNLPNYEEIILQEALYYAEMKYEYQTNPSMNLNDFSEPLLSII